MNKLISLSIAILMLGCAGCVTSNKEVIDITKQVPSDLSGVVWLHTDVSGWAQTANLYYVGFDKNLIHLLYDKTEVWPVKAPIGGDANINANPWVFIRKNDKWYAATWEWMRAGQTTKEAKACAGDHIKHAEFNGWKPVSGETYGFMVSGLARSSMRNVKERSNVVMVQWP